MGKGSSPAPKPDPAIGQAALKQAQLGEDFLSFAKEQFGISNERQAELDAMTKRVAERQLEISDADRTRYETVFRPIEDEFVQTAKDYDSPERQEQAAAEAAADVSTAAAAERGAAERRSASMGIAPTSGRFAGIDRAIGLGTALASAGAKNNARQQVRDKGLALKADAINMGKGLPAQSAAAAGLGLGVTNDAMGSFRANTGIVGQGYSGAQSGYAGQASTLNSQYGNQPSAWQAEQEMKANNAAGIGSFLGTAAGMFLSSKKAKTDKKPLKEGEALDAVRDMPVESWAYKPGLGDGGGKRHVGPYAEDMARETGQGDGKRIAAQDAIGITLAAVKDLDVKVGRIAKAIGLGTSRQRIAA